MLKQHFRTANNLLRALDLLCISAGFVLSLWSNAFFFASAQTPTSQLTPLYRNTPYLLFLAWALLCWIGLSRYLGIYRRSHRAEPLSVNLGVHLKAQLLWMVATGFSLFAIKHYDMFSRGMVALFFVYSSLLLTSRLLMVVALLHGLRRHGYNVSRIAIIGCAAHTRAFTNFIEQRPELGYEVSEIREIQGQDAATAGASSEIEDVFIVAPTLESVVLKILKRGKRVHILPGMFDVRLFRQELDDFAGVPVLSIGGNGLSVPQAILKRSVDICGAGLLLALLSPLLAAIALAIRLTSPGDVLFRQKRLGQRGRLFSLYKFRTMVANAEEILQKDPRLYDQYVTNNFKLPPGQDPRITRLGRILRSTSLDELPQLLNVLKGDMSLVGPRPIVPPELEQYGDFAELFLSVKPGLTGNWQVNGRSEVANYANRAEMDLEYIRDRSLGKDVTILLKTIPAVIRRKGAH